jgi:ribosome-associated toxin RatA of RatAB toxin-antitoxin module
MIIAMSSPQDPTRGESPPPASTRGESPPPDATHGEGPPPDATRTEPGRDPRCDASPEIREVTDETGTRGIEVRFHLAVPADWLLELLWDVDQFARLFPDVKDHAVVRRGPGEQPTELDVRYRVNAVVTELSYVLRRTLDRAARSITWRELSGDLRRVRGGWWTEPTDADGVTLATYRAFVDPGRLIPTRLVARGARRKAGEMVDRLRRVTAEIHRESHRGTPPAP